MNQSQNRVAVITGADEGIGRAISERLAACNIRMALISNHATGLEKLERDIKKNHQVQTVIIALDVKDSRMVNSSINSIIKKYGQIDYLINVAGIAYFGGIELCTEEEWDETLNVNAKGYFLMAKSVFPHMKSRKKGMIINISSVWGTRGASNMLAYSTSKFAIEGFSKCLSEEARPFGIKVTSVILDKVDTSFRKNMSKQVKFSPEQKERMLHVNDVADAVSWLIESSARSLPSSITLEAFLWK